MDVNDVSREYLIQCLQDTGHALEEASEWSKRHPDSDSLKVMHQSMKKRQESLRHECIKGGYGEMVEGKFVLKENGE